jgi:GNAT superfamily N-acetyltransferase
MEIEVTTTYFEMTSPEMLRPKDLGMNDVVVSEAEIPDPAINHFFFVNVGRPWKWYSRLAWSFEDWKNWVESDRVRTWIGYIRGTPFGYFELEDQGSSIEISFIGVLPGFIGKGLGGFLLSEAVRIAWSSGPERIWVHTCSLDHKSAIPNYLARGFQVYKEETLKEQIPDEDDLIWYTPEYYRSRARAYLKHLP